MQDRGDPFGFGKGGILQEAQFGREFELDHASQLAAEKTAMPGQCGQNSGSILATQGLYEHRGMAHVRRRLHLRHCHRNTRQFGIGLTVAVLLDATVVRLILLPALIRLFGERTWAVPAWLDRMLPRFSPH